MQDYTNIRAYWLDKKDKKEWNWEILFYNIKYWNEGSGSKQEL